MSGQYAETVRNALVRAQADSLYLLLDCSNDPLTGELDGLAFDTFDETELVTNGNFDTSSNWDFGGSWSWSAVNQRAELTGTVGANGNLSPSSGSEVPIEVGKQYLLSYDIVGMSNGEVTASIGGHTCPIDTSAGVKTCRFTASATTDLNFYGELVAGAGKFYIRLDSVSLKQLGWIRGYGYLIGGAEFSGDIVPTASGGGSIGQDGTGVFQVWLDDTLTSGPNLNTSGLVFRGATGDIAVGNDNLYPGYYVQKTVLHNSVATDGSDDYTNLYQGDSGYQFIAMMYDIEDNSNNGICIGDSANEPTALIFGATTAVGMYIRLDRGNNKFVMRSTSYAQYVEIGLAGTDPALRPDTDDLIDLGDLANSLRWRHLYLAGTIDHDGSLAGFFNTTPVAQQTAPAALTDNSGGSTDDTIAAVSGTGDDSTINDNFAEVAEDITAIRTALVNLGLMA